MPDEIKPVSEYEQEWASFINVIKDRELAIILGAGLSYDSGIPTWQGEAVNLSPSPRAGRGLG